MSRYIRTPTLSIDVTTLLERIAVARARLEKQGEPPKWIAQDLRSLALECAGLVRAHIDVPALEHIATDEASVDTEALRRATKLLGQVPEADLRFTLPNGDVFDGVERLQRASESIADVERAARGHPHNFIFALEFITEPALSGVLLAMDNHQQVRAELIAAARQKTALLSDEQVLDLWSKLERHFDPERETHFDRASSKLPKDFLTLASPDDGRRKLAEYWVIVRPALEREVLLSGEQRVPTSIGLARALSWTKSAEELDASERALLTALARVSICWTLVGGRAKDLAEAFDLDAEGIVLDGQLRALATADLEKKDPTLTTFTYELESVVRLTAAIAGAPRPIESALRDFKLSREVEFPKELLNAREIPLQRHLTAYLLARGFPAMGTQQGASQVDVRVDGATSTLIIEVKRFGADDTPGAFQRLHQAGTQLLSYMDQAPVRRHGVLAIFNFSKVPVFAPPTSFHGRVLVVPINLCSVSPSGRTSHVDIVESSDAKRLFDVVVRAHQPAVKKKGNRTTRRSPVGQRSKK